MEKENNDVKLDLDKLTLEEIQNGYYYDDKQSKYCCLFCNQKYLKDEVIPVENKFYLAEKAMKIHVLSNHSNRLDLLLEDKNLQLTDKQKKFMELVNDGLNDKEISNLLKISTSSVRHQRYILKEKAKKYKIFLSIYNMVFSEDKGDDFINIDDSSKIIDERFMLTKGEQDKIAKTYFTTMEPLKLKSIPVKDKKKIALLMIIVEKFSQDTIYSEKEVNNILGEINEDTASLRRYLVEYGFMDRKNDGSQYWRIWI